MTLLLGVLFPAASATTSVPNATTFTSPNAQPSGEFGWAVAASGTSVVVGTPQENASAFVNAGHAYIFNNTGSLIATLTSPNAQSGGGFGYSVAVNGTVVVVGTPLEIAGGHAGAGHAYIFSALGGPPIILTSPNAQSYGGFGYSVSASGATVVVGAQGETAGGHAGAGHAYIFNNTGSLITTLTSPNVPSGPGASGGFGYSVAVSGTSVIVGAPGETAGGFGSAGHAYIFNNTGSLITTLTSPNAQINGVFGYSVAVSGTSVIVGASVETAGGFGSAGHAYIFNNTGSLITTLTSPNAQSGGIFGNSVAVSSTSVVAGAPNEGHAYIFDSTGSLIATLTSPNAPSGAFGYAVALSGSSVVVGAMLETADGFVKAGHAYLFPVFPPPDFMVAASPSFLTIKQEGKLSSGLSTITLTGLNGFSGAISLSATVSPIVNHGPTASLSSSTVNLPKNGQGTSTLTIAVPASTPKGTYMITVTGISGTLSHSVQVQAMVITI